MSLDELLKAAGIPAKGISKDLLNASVTSLTSDSREVQPGCVFVAIHGGTQDGHQFITSGKAQGALVSIGERAPADLIVSNTRVALAKLASAYFDHPSRKMLLVGVTGTSGKTTTTYLIESILKAAGHQVGVIGTVAFRFGETILPSTHTTPGPVELQSILNQMKQAGCTAVVMEVSSHALKQHRADEIAFDAMAFTNLSPEHMDFHLDMEDYFGSKARLFTDAVRWSKAAGKSPGWAINAEDSYGKRLLSLVKGERFDTQGLQVRFEGIRGKFRQIDIESPLTGRFNASNIACAIAVAQILKVDSDAISKGIRELQAVPGRMERVTSLQPIHVLVDYAHKPDALEKVLQTLTEVKGNSRLITVFGCGGDRDRQKRPKMGQIAAKYSDQVWVTTDNPRTEDPKAIIQEILQGLTPGPRIKVEQDRKKAIFSAIREAKRGDLVLIAGKGHEDYQIIGTQKFPFDDRKVALEALESLPKP